MTTDHQPQPTHVAWIENGILYHEYTNGLTLTNVLANEKTSLALLAQKNIGISPVIILLRDIDNSQFKLTFADYGRVLSTFDLARHASGIWIVGVTEEIKQTILTLSNYFFVNHIYFVDSLKEAQDAAHQTKDSTQSILDK